MKQFFDGIELTNNPNDVAISQWIYHSTSIDDYENPKWVEMINNEGLDKFYEYCEHNDKFRNVSTYQGLACFRYDSFNTVVFDPYYTNTERTSQYINELSSYVLRTEEGCFRLDGDKIVKHSGYGAFVSTKYDDILPAKPTSKQEFLHELLWQYSLIDIEHWQLVFENIYRKSVGTLFYMTGAGNPITVSEYICLCNKYKFDINFEDIACMQNIGIEPTQNDLNAIGDVYNEEEL